MQRMTPWRTNTISVREEDIVEKNLFPTINGVSSECVHRITSIYILDFASTDNTHLWFVEFTIPKA